MGHTVYMEISLMLKKWIFQVPYGPLWFETASCVIALILESTWSYTYSLPAPFRKLHKNLLNLI